MSRNQLRHTLYVLAAGAALSGCQISTSGLLKRGGSSSSAPSYGAPTPTDDGYESFEERERRGAQEREQSRFQITQLAVVEPEAGVAKVGKREPTWCKQPDPSGSADAFVRASESQYIWDSLEQALRFSCVSPKDARFQEQVGYFMQRWVNHTGASPELLAEYFTLRSEPEKFAAQLKESCAKLEPDGEASERAKTLSAMA